MADRTSSSAARHRPVSHRASPCSFPAVRIRRRSNQSDNLKAHTDNWFACMRSRQTPNGSIQTGFGHAVAVVMANRSFRENRKVYWDRKKEEIG